MFSRIRNLQNIKVRYANGRLHQENREKKSQFFSANCGKFSAQVQLQKEKKEKENRPVLSMST